MAARPPESFALRGRPFADAAADDTPLILAACDRVAAEGRSGVVSLGYGFFNLLTPLDLFTAGVKGVRIQGCGGAGPPAFPAALASFHNVDPAADPGTMLRVLHGAGSNAGAAVRLANNCTLAGVGFWWPNQVTTGRVAYPWAVNVEDAIGVTLAGLSFVNADQAVRCRRSYRFTVNGLAGSFLHRGLQVEWNKEFSQLQNVNWTANWMGTSGAAWDYYAANGEAFRFAEIDGLRGGDLSVYGSKVGFRLYTSDSGNSEASQVYGKLVNLDADFCLHPFQVAAAYSHGLLFDNVSVLRTAASDEPLVRVNGAGANGGDVRFSNCNLRDANGWYFALNQSASLGVANAALATVAGATAHRGTTTNTGVTCTDGVLSLAGVSFLTDQPQIDCGASFVGGSWSGTCNGTKRVTGAGAGRLVSAGVWASA